MKCWVSLSFTISYPDWIKPPYFADLTQRGDTGWKEAQNKVTTGWLQGKLYNVNVLSRSLILAMCIISILLVCPPNQHSYRNDVYNNDTSTCSQALVWIVNHNKKRISINIFVVSKHQQWLRCNNFLSCLTWLDPNIKLGSFQQQMIVCH
jgi:hypothetical protein